MYVTWRGDPDKCVLYREETLINTCYIEGDPIKCVLYRGRPL